MRTFILIILTGILFNKANAQTTFSPVESRLKPIKGNGLTELVCSSPAISVKFQLKHGVTILPQNNFVTVDGQAIQIILLKFSGYKGNINPQNTDSQKPLLDAYSKYELAYFKNDLGIELINPSDQWVIIKSKGWFIWYFKVGNVPAKLDKEIKIQLFASTVIGDNILTINAPILNDDAFNKAGLIVNDMMETLN